MKDQPLVIRLSRLPDYIGIKRTATNELMKNDPSFPKPIQLGPKSKGVIVAELEAWLAGRAAQRDAE